MFGKFTAAFILFSIAGSVLADGYSHPVVMQGVTQMADTAELHFDPAPAHTGTLVVLGDHTNTPKQSYPFNYTVPAPVRGSTDAAVTLDFSGKQSLTILCDSLSDICHSTGYMTEGTTTFSMAWKVTQR
jgi:hypothetical protein